jgi:ketol-acid reductoisomerase
LKSKTIAILGYGSQGHAQAQNLRDSGYKVIVGLDPNRQSAQQARADGMAVVAPDEAAKRADWIHVLTPDETQAEVYEQFIKPYLHPGKVLGFSHGFSIHFKTIVPPNDVDVVMRSSRMRASGRTNMPWPTLTALGRLAPEFCRPHLKKRPKATCSASRRCFAAG